MPKEPRCSICTDAARRVAVDELIAQGNSIRDVAGQTKCTRSSIHRHVRHSNREKTGGASRKSGTRGGASQAGRLSAGRCSTCGISVADTEPTSLLRRAERLLHGAELVVERAAAEDDYRLQLQGIDRVRSALELLMKAVGLVGGDGQVTVNLNADAMNVKKAFGIIVDAIPATRRDEFARMVTRFVAGETYECEALPANAESIATESAA